LKDKNSYFYASGRVYFFLKIILEEANRLGEMFEVV
jgi:hypothetical protein